MIQINIRTNTVRKTVTAERSNTPNEVFANNGLSTHGAMVNLNGTILSAVDLNATFEALGVANGSTNNLNAIVKADGAR